MNLDRWEEVKTTLSKKFDLADNYEEPFDFMGSSGVRDVLELKTPAGRMRAILETRPKVASREFHYSHRAGDSARTTFTLSEDEVVHTFKVERLNDEGDWEEIPADGMV